MIDEQERELQRAVIDRGKYRFCTDYQHLVKKQSGWFLKMSAIQKEAHLKKVAKANLRKKSASDISNLSFILSDNSDEAHSSEVPQQLEKTPLKEKPDSSQQLMESQNQLSTDLLNYKGEATVSSLQHLENYASTSQQEVLNKASELDKPIYSHHMFGLQYQSSDNDWEGEVTLSSQDLVNSSALQQVELETSKECNKPTCSRRLFESQYQSLKDGHSLPGITVCTTVTSHSPIQSHTSLAGRQYASSATASTSQTHALNTTSLPNSEDSILSVPISDFSGSVITPTEVLKAIWKKASELLHEPNSLSLAPGQGDSARMVKSYSGSRPHLVTCKRSGQYACDNKCPNWRSLGICAHSVAAAEDNHELLLFVRWFTKAKKVPNITKLATTEMPAGRGHKGSKAPPKKRPKVQPESRIPFSVVSGVQGKRSYHESRTLYLKPKLHQLHLKVYHTAVTA